ncbi:MAG: DUF192 domain-containing protein [Planctomycetes bacterium]|nr:DUF192 domain-containing protein [Planctomycetota bacterium]
MYVRQTLVGLLVVFVLAMGFIALDDAKKKDDAKGLAKQEIVIGGENFKLEVAADVDTRARGLMGRKTIDEHSGMLFIYRKSDLLSFWMKNCLTDMDIIYLDRTGKIVAMHEMKKEPVKREDETQSQYENRLKSYPSKKLARYVIELKPGSNIRLKLKEGDKIKLDLLKLREIVLREERKERLRKSQRKLPSGN